MNEKKKFPAWMAAAAIRPALVTGMALFVTSYALDLLLDAWGVVGTATILDNLVIGILGALAVMFYLSASYEHHNFERAKERMELVSEVNRRVREVFGELAESAILEDRTERLRRVDEATDRMDSMLSGLGLVSGKPSKGRGVTPGKEKGRVVSLR